MSYAYDLAHDPRPCLGLIVLQTDETIEDDFRRMLPGARLFVSRVPSGQQVTPESLAEMEDHIAGAASLLPRSLEFAVVGYGCTSGTAQIGADRVAELVRSGAQVCAVTDPATALVAACRADGVRRLAFLSPYVASVSDRLRAVLAGQGVETPVFGSFAEAEEARVARIDPQSIAAAARDLVQGAEGGAGAGAGVEGLFLSCTNLRTLDILAPLTHETGLRVYSSNQVLAWHMARLAGIEAEIGAGAGAPA